MVTRNSCTYQVQTDGNWFHQQPFRSFGSDSDELWFCVCGFPNTIWHLCISYDPSSARTFSVLDLGLLTCKKFVSMQNNASCHSLILGAFLCFDRMLIVNKWQSFLVLLPKQFMFIYRQAVPLAFDYHKFGVKMSPIYIFGGRYFLLLFIGKWKLDFFRLLKAWGPLWPHCF